MNNLIKDLTQAREKVIEVLTKVSDNKKSVKLAGEWDLKDLIAHLTGWANYQVEVIKAMKDNLEPPEPGKIDHFNLKSTQVRMENTWKEIYDEWLRASQKMIDEYSNISDKLWNKPLWRNKKITLEKFINIEIKHYQETHLPQIKNLLKASKE